MNMNAMQQRQTSHPTAEPHAPAARLRLYDRLFSTNWGLVLIGALLAFAIGTATLHNGYVESRAQEAPQVEAEAETHITRSAP